MIVSLFSYRRSVLFVCAILAMGMPIHAADQKWFKTADNDKKLTDYKTLLRAIIDDNPRKVVAAITNDEVVNYCNDSEELMAPLNFAAHLHAKNNVQILKILMQHGADINLKDGHGDTVLMVVAANGRSEAVQLLLDHGADTTLRDAYKKNAAQRAIQNKHPEIAKMIIEAGLKQARAQQTAVQTREIVPALDSDAANAYSENSDSESTIPYTYSDADTYSSSSDLSESSDEEALNMQNNKGRTVLMDAFRLNRSFLLKTFLLTHGSNPNLRTKQTGKTALFYAVQKENSEDVGLLLHFHANPLISDAFGQTPLMYASHSGNTNIMEQLLDDGAIETINAVDHKGITALTRATDQGHITAAQFLLERGARVYPSGQGNITPVYVAHKKRNVALLQILLKYAMEERSPDLEDEIASLL